MICPMCLGKGYATDEDIKEYPYRCPNCHGKGSYMVDWQKFRCDVCKGSGKKPMTEQEYIQTCNTEQLADVLFSWYKLGRLDVINKHTEVKKDWLIEHLKQPHREE